MIDILKMKFEECKNTNSYKRIDSLHPLDIYLGYDSYGKKSIVIVITGEISEIESTKMIEVQVTRRTDEKVNLSFSLIDEAVGELFLTFCEDIISSTRKIKGINGFEFIVRRWKDWINLFKNPHTSLLTENEIRGLLGELIILKNIMFKKYGVNTSIESWIGSSYAHKDFEIGDTWYEVKTIKENAITVKISSIEQLDSKTNGILAIVKLEQSNLSINNPISLNNYINSILVEITEDKMRESFINKLNQGGYCYAEEYDKYIYSNKGIDKYLVDDDFPKLKKENLQDGIVRVSYELYLNNISRFIILGD